MVVYGKCMDTLKLKLKLKLRLKHELKLKLEFNLKRKLNHQVELKLELKLNMYNGRQNGRIIRPLGKLPIWQWSHTIQHERSYQMKLYTCVTKKTLEKYNFFQDVNNFFRRPIEKAPIDRLDWLTNWVVSDQVKSLDTARRPCGGRASDETADQLSAWSLACRSFAARSRALLAERRAVIRSDEGDIILAENLSEVGMIKEKYSRKKTLCGPEDRKVLVWRFIPKKKPSIEKADYVFVSSSGINYVVADVAERAGPSGASPAASSIADAPDSVERLRFKKSVFRPDQTTGIVTARYSCHFLSSFPPRKFSNETGARDQRIDTSYAVTLVTSDFFFSTNFLRKMNQNHTFSDWSDVLFDSIICTRFVPGITNPLRWSISISMRLQFLLRCFLLPTVRGCQLVAMVERPEFVLYSYCEETVFDQITSGTSVVSCTALS
ncbi:unnamed protein product [Nesidiocoris tenuis]|uniref:Uncharacterized protein n=1 Tax=Nesidiocoris tenuis TaxID=355587 RepID=A0A6H5FZP1_9HEMI|nr:unnamed protein product [Nesidiocoris tenuis]